MVDGRHFENRYIAIMSVKNRLFLMKFGTSIKCCSNVTKN